ncbi:hypothetical protein [Collimonas arenae]|nr:hypothetical protein [Collimonas arenae]
MKRLTLLFVLTALLGGCIVVPDHPRDGDRYEHRDDRGYGDHRGDNPNRY